MSEFDEELHESLVFGFVRIFERSQDQMLIPMNITTIIDRFYHIHTILIPMKKEEAFECIRTLRNFCECDDHIEPEMLSNVLEISMDAAKVFLNVMMDDSFQLFDQYGVMIDERIPGFQFIQNEPLDEELLETFKIFDKNQDGVIDFMDLKCSLLEFEESVTNKDVQDMMNKADLNGDGVIDFEEFKIMMNAQ